MRVADDDDTLGTFTHATSSPVLLTYFSISWLSFVVPSDEVKRMSLPVDRALLCRSVSVRLTRTGKLACAGAVPSTGTSLLVAVFRKTTTLEKSAPGLVQLTVTCAVPGVALGEVTSAGDWLSMVTVALAVSVPDWTLLLVKEVTVAVTA